MKQLDKPELLAERLFSLTLLVQEAVGNDCFDELNALLEQRQLVLDELVSRPSNAHALQVLERTIALESDVLRDMAQAQSGNLTSLQDFSKTKSALASYRSHV